jgi:hypothetical protein
MAAAFERGVPLPRDGRERYAGYGILGVAFASGDLLALRRFPVASSGLGYTAVWHRAPDGAWTFHTDASCDQGCTRHFAPALARVAVHPIRVEWEGPWRLAIVVDGGREIAWSVALARTWRTRLLTATAARLPEAWWDSRPGLRAIGGAARVVLGAGRLRLSGRLPSGACYRSNPRRVWLVSASRAVIGGVDAGAMTRLGAQPGLGDFLIPRAPLLAGGPLVIDPPPSRAR